MRGSVSKRASMLVALAALTVLSGTGARADHGDDGVYYKTWIQQAGNGAGDSAPVLGGENFNMRTTLYDAKRFPIPGDPVYGQGCASPSPPASCDPPDPSYLPRPGATRYYMYGTIPIPDRCIDHDFDPTTPDECAQGESAVFAKLAVSQSDNGIRWSEPQQLTIKDDTTGDDRPILVSDFDSQFTVEHGVWAFVTPQQPNLQQDAQFALFWHEPSSGDIEDFHRAVSLDGISFLDDRELSQTGTDVVGGTGCAFKCTSEGATDVVWQRNGSTDAACATVDPAGAVGPTPWNCKVVMIYHAGDAAGLESTAIAGSPDGLAFSGHGSALLSPGTAGAWDDAAATLGHVRILPSPGAPLAQRTYTLYYSGATGGKDCAVSAERCSSIGIATSLPANSAPPSPFVPSDGLTFQKVAAPATPHQLLEEFGVKPPHTLQNASPLDIGKVDHQPIYYTRINDEGVKDVYLAYTAPAPGAAPHMRFFFPNDFQNSQSVPIDIYIGDTIGNTPATIGLDYGTLELTIDLNGPTVDPVARPIFGAVQEKSIVDQYYYPGKRVQVRRDLLQLPDGVHRVTASVADLDGNITTTSMDFVVDALAPVTTLSSSHPSPKQRLPLSTIGTFAGETKDGNGSTTGTPLKHMRFAVTNPLGQVKNFDVFPRTDGTGPIFVTTLPTKVWQFSWAAPSLDPHFVLPGNYTVSALGVDSANNIELPSAANTVSLLVIG